MRAILRTPEERTLLVDRPTINEHQLDDNVAPCPVDDEGIWVNVQFSNGRSELA